MINPTPTPASKPTADQQNVFRVLGNAILYFGIATIVIGFMQILRAFLQMSADGSVPGFIARISLAVSIAAAGSVWLFCSASFRKLSRIRNCTADVVTNSLKTLSFSFSLILILAILRIFIQVVFNITVLF